MKKRVYLDTTIPSYYYDVRKETAFLVDVTRKWFRDEARHYDVFVSEATLVEASMGRYRNKVKIVQFIERYRMLKNQSVLDSIVEAYIKNFLMPKHFGGDALHLAYASYYKMDFLLTWNCEHLANANKREHIRIINNRLGLFVPEITTPLELMTG